jgi:hypothetical protein
MALAPMLKGEEGVSAGRRHKKMWCTSAAHLVKLGQGASDWGDWHGAFILAPLRCRPARPMGNKVPSDRKNDRRAPPSTAFPNLNKPKIRFLAWEKYLGSEEKSGNFCGDRKSNLEHFCHWHYFQFSMDFELSKRFGVKAVLTELC